MPVRPLLPLAAPLVLLAVSALAPSLSAAELYKWVDERGITNYSDQPPRGAVQRRGIVDNRVSVYTPDPQLKEAMAAERARAINDLRTGRRQRELQEDWLARQYFASAHAYPVDPCAGDPRCGSTPTYYPVGRFVGGHGVRILPQISLPPGTTAGNVTAGHGYIPGYSAYAPGTSVAPRAVLEGARAGGGYGRGGAGFGRGGGRR